MKIVDNRRIEADMRTDKVFNPAFFDAVRDLIDEQNREGRHFKPESICIPLDGGMLFDIPICTKAHFYLP